MSENKTVPRRLKEAALAVGALIVILGWWGIMLSAFMADLPTWGRVGILLACAFSLAYALTYMPVGGFGGGSPPLPFGGEP